MSSIINGGTMRHAAKAMQLWYNSQDEAQKLIIRHSCIGGAIALIPIPLVGEISVIVNQVAMYRGLNKLTGVSFSQNVLKSVGKVLLSQVAGALGGAAALFTVGAAAKFIPGVNFLAGFAQAPGAGVVNYVCGMAYLKMLGGFIAAGGCEGLSDEEIVSRMREHSLSADEIRAAKAEAQKRMKDADYAAYKSEAQSCADEARRNQEDYR